MVFAFESSIAIVCLNLFDFWVGAECFGSPNSMALLNCEGSEVDTPAQARHWLKWLPKV